MRIACVHIPQFGLQCVTRLDPSLRRAPVVVVGSGLDPAARQDSAVRVALHSPVVHACSRAAWALGVRLGMTATAARSLSPELRIVNADAQLERETVRAIADVLLGATGVVDLGGRVGAGGAHLAMYTDVPVKTRGASFGEKLVELLDGLGLAARIGIADDKFTAWVAASSHQPLPASLPQRAAEGQLRMTAMPGVGGAVAASNANRVAESTPVWDQGVISVPRGGSAAFLAPRPLSLLAISPEVQHMLEALGVRTLGEFAALPAPSVSRPQVAAAGADFQALARGESGTQLRPYVPESSIREDVVTSEALGAPTAIGLLGERLALRLAGRGREAARLEIAVTGVAGAEPRLVKESLVDPSAKAGELAETVLAALGDDVTRGARLRVTVVGEAMPGAREAMDEITAEGSAPIELVPSVLSVVLSSTGSGAGASGAWALTSPEPTMHSERRAAGARMRRGKQRRRTLSFVQPRLFKAE